MHTTTDGYDEVPDRYPVPVDAATLAWIVREIKDLRRIVGANYPNQRNSGGAVDSDPVVMGWPGPRQGGK